MKTKIIFDLSDPDQRVEHLRAVHADMAFTTLFNIVEAFRKLDKAGVEHISVEKSIETIDQQIPLEIFNLIYT